MGGRGEDFKGTSSLGESVAGALLLQEEVVPMDSSVLAHYQQYEVSQVDY